MRYWPLERMALVPGSPAPPGGLTDRHCGGWRRCHSDTRKPPETRHTQPTCARETRAHAGHTRQGASDGSGPRWSVPRSRENSGQCQFPTPTHRRAEQGLAPSTTSPGPRPVGGKCTEHAGKTGRGRGSFPTRSAKDWGSDRAPVRRPCGGVGAAKPGAVLDKSSKKFPDTQFCKRPIKLSRPGRAAPHPSPGPLPSRTEAPGPCPHSPAHCLQA